MSKITSLNKTTLPVLRIAIEAALASVAGETGVSLKIGSCRFEGDGLSAMFQLHVVAPGANGEGVTSLEEADFKRYASDFGLRASDLGREFTAPAGERYRVDGLKPNATKLPILATNIKTGKRYKFSVDGVVRGLQREAASAAV